MIFVGWDIYADCSSHSRICRNITYPLVTCHFLLLEHFFPLVMDPKIGQLVIDTNAIVHGTTLVNVAREYYTCPEVIDEIRSSHSRQYLDQLPFEIKIEDPTESAMRAGNDDSTKDIPYLKVTLVS